MKSRIQSMMWTCMALICAFFTSCTDDALMEASDNYVGRPFELTVSQSAPDSRLALDQQGLKTEWEPGDQLVLVNKNGKNAPIYLTCTLTENAPKAKFVSQSGVPAGDYFVIYNYNTDLAYSNQMFQTVDQINEHDNLVLWNTLSVADDDSEAQISLNHLYAKINVELKNVPDEGFGGQIGMYSPKKGFPMHLQFTNGELVDAEYSVNFNSMGGSQSYDKTYFPSNRRFHNIRFGNYSPTSSWDESTHTNSYDYSKAKSLSALVLPADLSGEDVYFYVLNGNKCYEIKKKGVNFQAGTSFNVVLDLKDVEPSTLSYAYDSESPMGFYELENKADWRHAAYIGDAGTYKLTNDISFEDDVFFPIPAYTLKGGGYTLSNINLDWSDEDYVGLVRMEWSNIMENSDETIMTSNISNLILDNVTFKGNNFVGAFSGWAINATDCKVIGNSLIEGKNNYVGGIVGRNRISRSNSTNHNQLSSLSVGQSCVIKGKNYVGGIVGRYVSDGYDGWIYNSSTILLMQECKSQATITATEDYVGGVFGKIGGAYRDDCNEFFINFALDNNTFSLIKCVNEGNVSGRHYVGGIGGEFAVRLNGSSSMLDKIVLSQSYSTGNVSGENNVGGILGASMGSVNTCYSIGEITAASVTGGIVGDFTSGYNNRIANCYSLATIEIGPNGVAGGIVGKTYNNTIINCYYAADPDEYSFGGIVGSSSQRTYVTNCLTTLNSYGILDFNRKVRNGVSDYNNDGLPDDGNDHNRDGVVNNDDLYDDYSDVVKNCEKSVVSILANKSYINADGAYSNDVWANYVWECVKFASFEIDDTDSPDFTPDSM